MHATVKSLYINIFSCRISDRGGGIPAKISNQVFDYNFTTSGALPHDAQIDGDIFSTIMDNCNPGPTPGKMHG